MNHGIEFLTRLEAIIRERLASGDRASYTSALAASGDRRIAQKIGEEGIEFALAAVAGTREEQLGEAADLVYHLLVMLAVKELSLADVAAVLENRHAG